MLSALTWRGAGSWERSTIRIALVSSSISHAAMRGRTNSSQSPGVSPSGVASRNSISFMRFSRYVHPSRIVAMQFQELGHRGVDIHSPGCRRHAPPGDEVSDIDLRHLNRLRELARRTLQFTQPAPHQLTNLHGTLQGEGCRHGDSFVAE